MAFAGFLIATGFTALVAFHGWWRNPNDLIVRAYRRGQAITSTLFTTEADRG